MAIEMPQLLEILSNTFISEFQALQERTSMSVTILIEDMHQ